LEEIIHLNSFLNSVYANSELSDSLRSNRDHKVFFVCNLDWGFLIIIYLPHKFVILHQVILVVTRECYFLNIERVDFNVEISEVVVSKEGVVCDLLQVHEMSLSLVHAIDGVVVEHTCDVLDSVEEQVVCSNHELFLETVLSLVLFGLEFVVGMGETFLKGDCVV